MPKSLVQLTQITLATTRTVEMVKFYDALFGTELQPTEVYGTRLYNGILAGILVQTKLQVYRKVLSQ